MKIGIRAHDLLKDTSVEEMSEIVKENEFEYLQLVLSKAFKNDNLLNKEKAIKYNEVFKRNNIKIAMLGAYFNPVHSNKDKVKDSIEKFKNHLEYAHYLNCEYVGTETGSFNDDKWTYNELNRTDKAYNEVKRIINDLVVYAEKTSSYVAIEGAYNHVIYSPTLLNKLVREIDSSKLKVIVDLYNYLDISNHEQRYEILKQAIDLMKDKIVIFHLKDYIVKENTLKQVGLGKGEMDFNIIIKMIIENCPNAYLIFEGITGEDIKSSKKFIESIIRREENGSK